MTAFIPMRCRTAMEGRGHCSGWSMPPIGSGWRWLLDVVYNHLGPEGNYLAKFGPYFPTAITRPGAADQFRRSDSDAVRQFVIDNACAWVRDFHLDGLRLDAVQTIYDLGPRHILADIQAAVQEEAGCRRPHRPRHRRKQPERRPPGAAGRIGRPRAGGRLERRFPPQPPRSADRAARRLLSGLRPAAAPGQGPRATFSSTTAATARFTAAGTAAASAAWTTHFVVCVQNHDQLGNSASGARLGAVLPPPAQRLAVGAAHALALRAVALHGRGVRGEAAVPLLLLVWRCRAGRRRMAGPSPGVRLAAISPWASRFPTRRPRRPSPRPSSTWTWPPGSPHAQLPATVPGFLGGPPPLAGAGRPPAHGGPNWSAARKRPCRPVPPGDPALLNPRRGTARANFWTVANFWPRRKRRLAGRRPAGRRPNGARHRGRAR